MSGVFVFLEHTNGQLKKSCFEVLGAAQNSGLAVTAFAVGSGAETLATAIGKYGVSNFILSKERIFDSYNPEAFANLTSRALQKSGAKIVLATSTMLSRDLFPRVAARLGAGLASDCTELKISGQDAIVRKPLYAGKCSARVSFAADCIKIILMRPNQLSVSGGTATSTPKLEEISPDDSTLRTLVKEIVRGASEKLDLTEANIIVSGGRGLKEAKNFEILTPLATILGATIGASRAVVDAGWVSHSMQVGQTGKTVAPSLYIACGISGAIQHMAGMSASKVIVAINNDPQAPIFQKATYGIVGDVFEVVPKLTEEFKRVLH